MRIVGLFPLSIIVSGSVNELTLSEIVGRGFEFAPPSLKNDGIFILNNAIDQSLLRSLAAGLVRCDSSGVLDDTSSHATENLDSSRRLTIAGTLGEDFHGCDPETNKNMAEYKGRIGEIGESVARYLDRLIAGVPGTSSDEVIPSVESMVMDAEAGSLDHFHVYNPRTGSEPEEAESAESLAVPFHYDMGLFLVLTPEMWIDYSDSPLDSKFSTLLVKKPDGTIVRVEPSDDSAVIIIIGTGLSKWLLPRSPFNACLHAVEPIKKSRGLNRVVLGRMFLPPLNTVSPRGVLFNDFFHAPITSIEPSNPVAARWRRLSEMRCNAGKKHCWMMCLPEPDCGGEESVCMNAVTLNICSPNECNTDCKPMCPVKNSLSSFAGSNPLRSVQDDEALFCQGGTSMVMSGFESVTDSEANCIILFFRSWLLNTPIKFFFGCIGVLLLGMMIEATIKLRRFVSTWPKLRRTWMKDAAVTTLFGTNVALGYLAMLAAMTFNIEIFISTVVGLAIGHLVFANSKQPVRETADPCCVTSENLPDVSTNLRNSTGACCCNINS